MKHGRLQGWTIMPKIWITILNHTEISNTEQDCLLLWKQMCLMNHQNTMILNLKYNWTEKKYPIKKSYDCFMVALAGFLISIEL